MLPWLQSLLVPDDDRVLEAAQTAGAAVIVSGDRLLPSLGHWGEVCIVNPAEFLADRSPEYGSGGASGRAHGPLAPHGAGGSDCRARGVA